MDTHTSTVNEYTDSRSGDHDQAERHEDTAQPAPVGHAKRVIIPGEGEQVDPVPLTAAAPPSKPSHVPAVVGGKQSKASRPLIIGGLALTGVAAIGFYFATTHYHPASEMPPINPPAHVTSPAAQAIHPQASLAPAAAPVKAPAAQVRPQADMSSLMALQNGPPADTAVPPVVHPGKPSPAVTKPSPPAVAVVINPTQVSSASGVKLMTQQQQAEVLQMLTRLAAVVRDLRLENSVRQQQLDLLSKTTHERLDTFDSRLSFAEAHNAVDGAVNAGASPPADAKPVPASTRTVAQPGVAAPPPASEMPILLQTPTPVALRKLNDYRLQAASPGLAVLQVLATGLNEPGILQVAAGDSIPGLGRILSIAQHGATWEVRTNRGVIR